MANRMGWRVALVAVALAAIPARRAAAEGPGPAAAAGDAGPARLGGFAGYGAAATSGLALRGDGELPSRVLGGRVALAWLGSVGFSRLTRAESGFGVNRSVTVALLQVVPGARLSLALGGPLRGYLDAGVGLYRAGTTVRQRYAFGLGSDSTSSSELAGMLRFGAGFWMRASSRLDVGGGVALEPHLGRFGETTFVFQAGAMYRL
jgi:hypothetical protein